MTHQIIFTPQPTPGIIQRLSQGIAEYAQSQTTHPPIEPYAFLVVDSDNRIMGGCNGNIGYGWVYIDQLWVDVTLRGQGYGSALMQQAEILGRQKNCLAAAVNTMQWEALEFYKKLGYHIEFERKGLIPNSTFYMLRKDFVYA